MSANKISANRPIQQTGAYGYLLWLRRDLPPVYAAAVKQYPEVATFEGALQRQAGGLGQDDESVDLSTIVDNTSDMSSSFTIEPAPIVVPAPELPTVAIPSDSSGSVGQAAANVGPSTIAAIAQAAAAIVPAALNTTAAVINHQTAAKTLATAQIQYGAYTVGRAPYQTGIVTGPTGAQYLAAVSSPYAAAPATALSQSLSANVFGLPLWAWLLGGAGLLVLIAE